MTSPDPDPPAGDAPIAALPDERELDALLADLERLLSEISAQSEGVHNISGILAEHRGAVYRSITALGDWINAYLAGRPHPEEAERLRRKVAAPIRAWSATSPTLHHSSSRPRDEIGSLEVMKRLQHNRPAGADVAALVFDDFYLNAVVARAFRGRLALLTDQVRADVAARAHAGQAPVRVLNLHPGGGMTLETLSQDATFAAAVALTCLDSSAEALRHVRDRMGGRLKRVLRLVRADPSKITEAQRRHLGPQHLIYAASLFDHLDETSAARLARDCRAALAPGGMLVAGSHTPAVPANELILRAWLADWRTYLRDEPAWRTLLTEARFPEAGVRFLYEPLRDNVLVLATTP